MRLHAPRYGSEHPAMSNLYRARTCIWEPSQNRGSAHYLNPTRSLRVDRDLATRRAIEAPLTEVDEIPSSEVGFGSCPGTVSCF